MTDEPYQVTERGDPRDRIHNQRPLFDVDRTTSKQCAVCFAMRQPDEDKAAGCQYDHDTRHFGLHTRRPKGCLNAHDPAHAPFPEGY